MLESFSYVGYHRYMQHISFKERKILTKIQSEKWRHYHSVDNHIVPMIETIINMNYPEQDKEILLKAAIYHDAIYDPKRNDNEIESEKLFRIDFPEDNIVNNMVSKMILATITHESDDWFVNIFLKLDLMNFESDFSNLIKNQVLLRKEYQFYELNVWKEGSIKILQRFQNSSLLSSKAKENIAKEIEFVKFYQPKIGVFAGSFNPFHLGHLDIITKAEKVFDEIIILKGKNPEKEKSTFELPECLKYYQVIEYDGALAEFVMSLPYEVSVIRGLRNTSDFQGEINFAQHLKQLSNDKVNVVPFFTSPELQHISSSDVRSVGKIYGINSKQFKSYLP